ncbi:hypothetical protein NIES4071_69070 [Calothrix sp. NIES-4071]|nr:hypothetical protein NIES4071_69070 [Calothrix sp. NIES-4071]BAZ61184.1 hypothetical protein NIES4105_69020 [Calothrix sp. NIES-4105]
MREFAIQAKTIREAWEQGLQQGLNQVAVNMLYEGIDINLVAKLTGFTIEQIKDLQISELDDSHIVKDFMELSESSLNKVWLNPEEDEAWKYL